MKINKIEDLKQRIDLTAELFYQQKSQEGYQSLVVVIDGLLAITNELKELKEVEESEQIAMFRGDLAGRLQEITEAMLQKDTILIADMLKYDIVEILDHIEDIEN